jgi:hypothetical protein
VSFVRQREENGAYEDEDREDEKRGQEGEGLLGHAEETGVARKRERWRE